MTGRTGHFLVTIIVLVTISVSCNTQKESGKGRHVVSDSWERSMHVPDSIRSVTCLGSGALRLICYMDLADRVKYIEGNEKRRSVPYILANPRLRLSLIHISEPTRLLRLSYAVFCLKKKK